MSRDIRSKPRKKLFQSFSDGLRRWPATTPASKSRKIENDGKILESEEIPTNEAPEISSSCGICDRNFSLVTRKSTCKQCLKLVCSKCSTKSIPLDPESTSLSRVCDDCHHAWYTKNTKSAIPSGKNTLSKFAHKSLEEWMFALKPVYKEGAGISIGVLNLQIQEARDLPKMDKIGTADPYVVVEFESETVQTMVRKNTLNPQWASENYLFPVTSALSVIKFTVYDHDLDSADDLIGTCSIALTDLTHQHGVTEWIRIKLDPGVVADCRDKGIKIPDAQIRLHLKYDFSKTGEFISHVTPVFAPLPPPEPFNVKVTYRAILRLAELLSPVFSAFTALTYLLMWVAPIQSLLFVYALSQVCLHPRLLMIGAHLFIIHHIIWHYVLIRWRESRVFSGASKKRHLEQSLDLKREESERMMPAKQKDTQENEDALEKLITMVASRYLGSGEVGDTLEWVQNMIVWLNELIEWGFSLLDWTEPYLTKTVRRRALRLSDSADTLWSGDFMWVLPGVPCTLFGVAHRCFRGYNELYPNAVKVPGSKYWRQIRHLVRTVNVLKDQDACEEQRVAPGNTHAIKQSGQEVEKSL